MAINFETAGVILGDVSKELGLEPADDPFASQDPIQRRLVVFLTKCGRMLVRAWRWPHLQKTFTFTSTSASNYPVPADFDSFLVDGSWNTTNRTTLEGSPFGSYQQLMVLTPTGTPLEARYLAGTSTLILAQSPVVTGQLYQVGYYSNAWVLKGTDTAPSVNRAAATTDTLWLDSVMLGAALKAMWLRSAGFDSSAATAEFEQAFDDARGAVPAPVLDITEPPPRFPFGSTSVVATDSGGGTSSTSYPVLYP